MPTAADMTGMTKGAVGRLIADQHARSGSKTEAYRSVARTLGCSSSWLYKYLSGTGEVREPSWSVFFNIRDQYNRLCDRVEQEYENTRTRNALLRQEFDAAVDSITEVMSRQVHGMATATVVVADQEKAAET